MLRDAVGVVPYEPAQSLKHNDTRGKTVRPCHVNAPYPPMTVGGDSLFARVRIPLSFFLQNVIAFPE